jgi:MoaA/NifB/PqqE/SkfB family radical SAM enzyme
MERSAGPTLASGDPLDTSPSAGEGPPADVDRLIVEPFLHTSPTRIENPLTGRAIAAGDPGFPELIAALRRTVAIPDLPAPTRRSLRRDGWLVRDEPDLAARYRLRYVSLESHIACNQSCYFCPVSIAPRSDYVMPTATYRRIVDQLAAWRETIEAVFMILYNEPTLDRRFVELVGILRAAGLPPAVLTNGTGLTPKRVDALLELGGLRYLSINLSTLDPARYATDRGGDHLDLVLRNLDYLARLPLADEMVIVVLGQGDDVHRGDTASIAARFADTRFEVKPFEVMDRAGYLRIGMKPARTDRRLRGCENNGSRPLQHLHVTPHAKAVFCCQDYDEYHVVGDLERQSVAEVLSGPEIAQLRRWSYGLEDAPEDFMCRKCVYALFEG